MFTSGQRDSPDSLSVERILNRELFAGRNWFSRDIAREVHVLNVEFRMMNDERIPESGLSLRIRSGIRFSSFVISLACRSLQNQRCRNFAGHTLLWRCIQA